MKSFLRNVFLLGFSLFSFASCGSSYDEDDCMIQIHKTPPVPYEAVKSYRMIIDKDIPANKMGPIMLAAAEWSTTAQGRFVFELIIGDVNSSEKPRDGEMRVWMSPDPDPNSNMIGSANWWGYDLPLKSIIWIQDDLNDRTHYLVSLHEVGHAVGLEHDQDAQSIMQPIIHDVGDHPNCVDRKSLCKIWGCDPLCQ